jgi:hypothetical protein
MAAESLQQDIQVSVGKDLTTAIIGGYKVEVSPDSNVSVYTNDGVQTRPGIVAGDGRKGTHISISEDFNIVVLNGAAIERAADGHLVISTPGVVITKPAPANDYAAINAQPQIGDMMAAGHPNACWIYAGISKTTHQPFYVAPKDSGVFKWKEAMTFAANDGSRVPSQDELDQIYEARNKGALKGTFNVTGSLSAGWYWSARDSNYDAWAQRFSDGLQSNYYFKDGDSSLRCVR